MDEKDQYKTVIAALILIGVATILLSPPELIFQHGVMVDTAFSYTSNEKTWVRTSMKLGSNEAFETIPFTINGGWNGYSIEVKENIIETLKPDILLERVYYNLNATKPVWFIIIRAGNTSAFHDPKICYRGAGWSIINETQVEVKLNGSNWTSKEFIHKTSNNVKIMANKLIIEKNNEYKLIMYFYMKEFILTNSPGEITLIRAETTVDDLSESSRRISSFLGEILPYLFTPISSSGEPIFMYLYQRYGTMGFIFETILVSLPVIYIINLVFKGKIYILFRRLVYKIIR